MASITENDLQNDRGGYLRALKEGRYMYVFVTTDDEPTTVYLTVLILNRGVTERIIGNIFEVYALTRSA